MKILIYFLAVSSSLLPVSLRSQSSPLFDSDEVIELHLVTDFEKLLTVEEEEEAFDFDEEDDLSDEPQAAEQAPDRYIPGILRYKEPGGSEKTMEIELRARGHFRLAYCDFPPLKFRFFPDKIRYTPFEDQYKLKLVTHCENDLGRYSEAVIHEYLIYKCYKLISDLSLDVRLANLNYSKPGGPATNVSSYAFFIQSIDELAATIGATEIEDPDFFADPPNMVPDHKLAFFQYMIGNNDWAIPGHNCKMLTYVDRPDTIAIPYDFDLAYLANAHSFPLPVKEYKGGCPTEDELASLVTYFNEKKNALSDVYRQCSWLDESSKQKNIDYIEGFYKTINDPGLLREDMLKKCKL